MKKTILFASVITAVIVTSVMASVGSVEAKPPESLAAAVCPAENVQHWETLEWVSDNVFFDHPTLPSVDGGIIKAQVDPSTVYSYIEVAASALNTMGYLNSGSPITASDIGFAFDRAEPQIICAES